MSSPIGGFYLNAQYRKKAANFELTSKAQLTLETKISIDNQMVLEDSQTCLSEHELKIDKEHLSVIVLPTVIDNEMIRLEFTLNITEPNRDSPVSKQQILNLSPGESLTALVEGDERIKLTTSCSII